MRFGVTFGYYAAAGNLLAAIHAFAKITAIFLAVAACVIGMLIFAFAGFGITSAAGGKNAPGVVIDTGVWLRRITFFGGSSFTAPIFACALGAGIVIVAWVAVDFVIVMTGSTFAPAFAAGIQLLAAAWVSTIFIFGATGVWHLFTEVFCVTLLDFGAIAIDTAKLFANFFNAL